MGNTESLSILQAAWSETGRNCEAKKQREQLETPPSKVWLLILLTGRGFFREIELKLERNSGEGLYLFKGRDIIMST